MKKTLLAAMALVATICNVNAQDFSAADQAKMNKYDLIPGKIVTLKGDTLTGFLRKMKLPVPEDFSVVEKKGNNIGLVSVTFPVEFGAKIKFVSTADFNANEKIKNKILTKYEPKELKGYVYDYTNTNRQFVSVKVKCKDIFLKGQGFVEVSDTLPNGEILCQIYNSVGTFTRNNPTIEDVEDYLHTYQGMFTSNTEAVLITDQDPAEFYKTRCPEIAKKWSENYYTKVTNKQGGALNGLSKFMSKIDADTHDKVRMDAFNDYLNTCGSVQK